MPPYSAWLQQNYDGVIFEAAALADLSGIAPHTHPGQPATHSPRKPEPGPERRPRTKNATAKAVPNARMRMPVSAAHVEPAGRLSPAPPVDLELSRSSSIRRSASTGCQSAKTDRGKGRTKAALVGSARLKVVLLPQCQQLEADERAGSVYPKRLPATRGKNDARIPELLWEPNESLTSVSPGTTSENRSDCGARPRAIVRCREPACITGPTARWPGRIRAKCNAVSSFSADTNHGSLQRTQPAEPGWTSRRGELV
jgi:hypothetical protein